MATAPLASTDLGPEFADLIPAFLQVLDSIGFPDAPSFEKCTDNRIKSAAAPLFENLRLLRFLQHSYRPDLIQPERRHPFTKSSLVLMTLYGESCRSTNHFG